MFADIDTPALYAHFALAGRFAREYAERARVARGLRRATMAENAHKWRAERQAARDVLLARLTAAQAEVAKAGAAS